jgi:hypothetical protein
MSTGPRNDVVEAIALKNAGALGYLVALYSGALVRAGNRTTWRSRCLTYNSRVK